MAHEDLESYYKLNFALMQHHKYSLTELENMIPWEREDLRITLQQHVEEENLKAQQEEMDEDEVWFTNSRRIRAVRRNISSSIFGRVQS